MQAIRVHSKSNLYFKYDSYYCVYDYSYVYVAYILNEIFWKF